MAENKDSAGNRSWSKKVDPKRGQTEESRAKRDESLKRLHDELFGAPDPALMSQMESSINKLAVIGNHLPQWNAEMPPMREAEEA